jgi:uncharacterized protein YfbU (UPF0304 family)
MDPRQTSEYLKAFTSDSHIKIMLQGYKLEMMRLERRMAQVREEEANLHRMIRDMEVIKSTEDKQG